MNKFVTGVFYVIGNYYVMFLLHKNAPRGCDQMHEEYVRFVRIVKTPLSY